MGILGRVPTVRTHYAAPVPLATHRSTFKPMHLPPAETRDEGRVGSFAVAVFGVLLIDTTAT